MQHVELGSPSSWGSTPPGRCATGSPGRDRCGERPGPGTSDAQRTAELERENRELRTSNAILRSASLVGWTGDPYDNALAEAFNSLFKAGSSATVAPWRSIDDLEVANAEYTDWFHRRRVHGEIGLVLPTVFEDNHYRHNPAPAAVASVPSLH